MAKTSPSVKFSDNSNRLKHLQDEAVRDANSQRDYFVRLRKATHPAAMHSQKDRFENEDRHKLLLLCQHYEIQESPTMYFELALELARELFPEAKRRGRKSKWSAPIKGALVVEVERLVRPNDLAHGVGWACTQLAKREPWASFLEEKEGSTLGPDPAEALRKVYFDFRGDKWANFSRDAFKMHEHEGAISEWEKQVSEFLSMDFVRNLPPK